MARNNVQTTVHVGMDVKLAKRNAEALKDVIATLKKEAAEWRAQMEKPLNMEALEKAKAEYARLELQIKTLQKVQKSATPAAAYEGYISGDRMNSNTLRQAQRGAKNRLNTVAYGEGDAEARRLIDDTNAIQKQLNRLQAGFTRPFQTIKNELNQLSGGELQRLHQLLQQEQPLVKGNEKAWANYSAAIAKVEERMREYDTAARQQAGAATLSKAQSGGFATANERDMQRAIDKLKEYRAVINDPSGTGRATYEATNAEITKLQANLDVLKQKEQEARGQSMSLATALQVGFQSLGGTFTGTTRQLNLAKKALEDNLLTAQRGSTTYESIKRALNGVELELQKTGTLTKEVQAVLNSPKGKTFNELKQAVEQGRAALANMRTTTEKEKQAFDELAKKVKEADFQMKQLAGSSKGTASAFEKAWSRLKTYVGLYVGAAVAMQKVVATMGDLMELSDKMGEVQKTTSFTADEVGRLSESLKKLDTRTSLTSLMELSAAAGQLGLKTEEDVRGFTEAANMLMVALPEMGREGATEMMKVALATGEIDKIRQQMQQGLIEGSSATAVAMTKIGSTIDQLRANSAAAAPQITDFVKRVGAVGAQSGISIDQVAALGATVDALGMRVEMSATALSRMIPAIKNNSFAIGKAIGVTQSWIDEQFKMGNGMEVILKIFDHIREANMNADSIENLFGSSMQDIMKELNQQGARAGIVFAGLAQGVDELRRNLGTAGQAYEENIAIQNEYNKMNDTTAAKWERLKNQLEEFFVGDRSQRVLGGIIDGLRSIVDLLTGNGGVSKAIRIVATTWAVFKLGIGEAFWKYILLNLAAIGKGLFSIGTTITGLKTKWIASWKAMDAATKANWIMAIVAALYMAGKAIVDWATKVDELDEAFHKLQTEEEAAERDINRLASSVTKTSATVAEATKKHDELTKQTETLRKEVDEMKKSTDLSSEAQKKLKEKTDQLKKSEEELKKATDEMNDAKKAHRDVIAEINSKYSNYLGYMLSEVTNASLVESAHWRIVAALRAELEQKRLLENQKAIENKYGDDIKEWTQDSRDELKSLPKDVQDRIMRRRSEMMAQVSYDMQETVDKNGKPVVIGRFVVPAIDGLSTQPKQFATEQEARNYLKKLTVSIVKQETVDRGISLGQKTRVVQKKGDYLGTTKRVVEKTGKAVTPEEFVNQIWGGAYGSWSLDDGFQRLTTAELKRMEDQARQQYQDQGSVKGANTQLNKATLTDIQRNANEIATTLKNSKTLTDSQISEMGRQLNAVVQSSLKYGGSSSDVSVYFGGDGTMTLENAASKLLAGLDQKTRSKVLTVATGNKRAGTGGTTAPTYTASNFTNPYGSYDPVKDPYTKWDADALVDRKKQMLEYVRALANGADVQSVLAKDERFINDATKKNIKTTEQAIEWYNKERLKIQDALHAKHLTNEGNWDHPTKKKAREQHLRAQWKANLDEIDAYYTERKTKIQEAATEEGVSEGEVWQRTLANEREWRNRRADLQKLYADKASEVSKEEADAIYGIIASRTGDTTDMVQKLIQKTVDFSKAIGKKNYQEYLDFLGKLDFGAQRDYLKAQKTFVEQMKAIQAIIDKERPFNGITENLQENLAKMGILTADMQKEREKLMKENADMSKFNERQAEQELKRTAFLLQEAENAYKLTAEQLMEDMRNAGFGDWADAIAKDDTLQRGLLAQLHQTFDAVQDAIKKESSLIKKQAEIAWNDVQATLTAIGPDGETQKISIKQAYDSTLSALGLQKDQVSRANSLIGAGQASERVADKLAIKQMQVQLAMQQHYYNLVRQTGLQRIADLNEAAKKAEALGNAEEAARLKLDAQHATMSLNLSLSEEQKKLDEQRVAIANQLEESQNRLYKELREWADLLYSSLQSIFEADAAGAADYYNELAKLNLTGKGGPGAGTYVVIDNAGTSKASAHYEYLDEREALDRQRQIEQENARAEAWKKVMDDINQRMNDMITDQLNAMLQNQAVNANTDATNENTKALKELASATERNAQAAAKAAIIEGGKPMVTPVVSTSSEQPSKAKTPVIEIGGLEGVFIPEDQENTQATRDNTGALNNLADTVGAVSSTIGTPAGGSQTGNPRQQYINQYADAAMEQMRKYGIPASVTLAQGLFESGNGQSRLARQANNHFGVKGTFHGNYMLANDDRPNEKFRKYDSVDQSYEDHSKVLMGQRYQKYVGDLAPDDYKGWVEGIKKGGYATDPNYVAKIVSVIEKNGLQKYDQMVLNGEGGARAARKRAGLEVDSDPYNNTGTTDPTVAQPDTANTDATNANTQAVNALTQTLGGQGTDDSRGTTEMPVTTPVVTPAPTSDTPAETTVTVSPVVIPAEAGNGGDAGSMGAGGSGSSGDLGTGGLMGLTAPWPMTEEELQVAQENLQLLWQAYQEGGVTALQEMAETLAEVEGVVLPPWQISEEGLEIALERMQTLWETYAEQGIETMTEMAETLNETEGVVTPPWQVSEEGMEASIERMGSMWQGTVDASTAATVKVIANQTKIQKKEKETDDQIANGSKSAFAKMTQAANLYGIAYQAMSNDNLSTTQKFELMAVQAAGNAAISMLTTDLAAGQAKNAVQLPGILGKLLGEMPYPAAIATFAIVTGLLGGLMGLAVSQISKSKSQIAQATGASASGGASAGRLSTGMLTYAEGNVNEFTDPATLTPGRQYNVDAADGRTYRARYMGSNPRTHLTNGPEFHLSGERGREMIIDAGTTRQITMNEGEIWHAIQTLSGGGSLRALRSQNRRRGVRAFADGNVEDFSEFSDYSDYSENSDFGMSMEQAAALQASIDRQSDLLADLRANGIKAHFDVYGKGGLIDSYDTGKKTVNRHGERY